LTDSRLSAGRSTSTSKASGAGRIKEAFYANLFLMMAESDRREITGREIDERREEKMLPAVHGLPTNTDYWSSQPGH